MNINIQDINIIREILRIIIVHWNTIYDIIYVTLNASWRKKMQVFVNFL